MAQVVPNPEDPAPLLKVAGLRVARHDPVTDVQFILDVPRFEVGVGDRVGFVGESGSGKTTFLETLGLLTWPSALDAFELSLCGDGRKTDMVNPLMTKDANMLSTVRAASMGFITQDGGLLPYLTILENALLAAELSGGQRSADQHRITETAEAMGIAPFLHRMPAALSGGQRQRAAVLRALAPGARLLIGDEPTAALDPSSSADVMNLLAATTETFGASVVLATHNASLLREFGFRVFRINVDESETVRRATLAPEVSA